MGQIKFDCRQLANVDFSKERFIRLPTNPGRLRQPASALPAVQAALRAGENFSSTAGMFESITDIAVTKPSLSLIAPAKVPLAHPRAPGTPLIPGLLSLPIKFAFSSGTEMTASGAVAGNLAFWGPTAVVALGLYATTTGEWGRFVTLGGGITFNSPGASLGGEISHIWGKPDDFKDWFVAIAISTGEGAAFGFSILFVPTLPIRPPVIELTLMGYAYSLSATTPTKLPISVTIEVTHTKIQKLGMMW